MSRLWAPHSRDHDSVLSPPKGYVTPPFPSLHNPSQDFRNRRNSPQLYYSKDIFFFTLYWTLIMYAATYGLCGLWAAVISCRSSRRKGRSPVPALLLLLLFLSVGGVSAVLGSAVVGYVLAAVYSVGYFTMSTWVPFLWALVQTLITIMGSYSTIVTLL
ncbi:uncharacterized protein EI90DRAFT_3064954 [Cantharellus anzutake]|uniref:uncharacterized protein n=1 Tax=Cantharellus anzutake TaxID=1750568 RepID=UPI001902D49D|nr:uncharacterized protein EI90DRAFT_3064954 [Cantharellus anzutake]KAF8328353.1 hypothetical protein EI90DRAFT_3064954 [Cantharellus anzutake]